MSKYEEVFDTTIIGAGPVGLFTAFYAGMRQMKVKLIESMPQLGGQLAALYPEKFIYDIAGFPKIKAQELVDNLHKQMNQFSPTIILDQSVVKIEKINDSFKLTTNKDEIHYTKSIIITAGAGAFEPRRLDHQLAVRYENKNLHYFIKDLSVFKGRRVVICGGGDSAIDWALMLEPIAKEVTVIHRRDKFRAHEYSLKQLFNSKVKIKTPYNVKEMMGNNEVLQRIVIVNNQNGLEETVDLDNLIVNFGFTSSIGPLKEWGLELEKNAILVNSKMETNIPGIFAAGDIATYLGKVKLIATGFGEAAIAISNAKVHVDPSARVQALHSTSIMGKDEKRKLTHS